MRRVGELQQMKVVGLQKKTNSLYLSWWEIYVEEEMSTA